MVGFRISRSLQKGGNLNFHQITIKPSGNQTISLQFGE
jgi:hypothetical protein